GRSILEPPHRALQLVTFSTRPKTPQQMKGRSFLTPLTLSPLESKNKYKRMGTQPLSERTHYQQLAKQRTLRQFGPNSTPFSAKLVTRELIPSRPKARSKG